jgi:hypothetical protein
LGHKGSITNDSYTRKARQRALYTAENHWGHAMMKDSQDYGQFLSPDNVRELVHETIHHPAMNDVPGIDELRARFNANDPLHLDIKPSLDYIVNNIGGVVLSSKQHKMYGRAEFPENIMRLKGYSQDDIDEQLKAFPEKANSPIHLLATKNLGGVRKRIVTHELSHLLTPELQTETDEKPISVYHEWPMARMHVHIANTILGKKYGDALKHYYGLFGVDFGNNKL